MFVDYLYDCKAELFAITETWLSVNDSAVCKEITPSGFKLLHSPRRSDRKGGGTALLFRDNISVHKVNCATFESFELSEYFVTAGSLRFRLAIIYRPPYSINHPVTVNTFIGEFSTYLESIVMSSEPLCLTGDFNIHVDGINDSAARLFADLLDSMALNQHVHSATHELGHTLDLVITRQSDHLIFGEPCADFLFSDHRATLFRIHSSRPSFKLHGVSFRTEMNSCSSTTDDPDLFCLLFDKSLRSILNHHAPVLLTLVFRGSINDEIFTVKRHRRKAERRWRSSRSTTDLLSFRLCRNRLTFLLNKARCAYYTNFVSENCLNQRKLFSACKPLLNLSKCASLP